LKTSSKISGRSCATRLGPPILRNKQLGFVLRLAALIIKYRFIDPLSLVDHAKLPCAL
jgi:hypothetical protein